MKVFISSTFRDLKSEREKLHKSLKKAGLESLGMEFFVAEPSTPKDVCLREIHDSDLVLLLISNSYGSKDPDTNKSYTHLEFEKAQEEDIEILGFLQKNPTEPEVQDFQTIVKSSGITIDEFTNISDIWTVLFPALFKYVISHGLIPSKTRTFYDFVRFYARLSQKGSHFNYSQTFFGRQEEFAQLDSFLSNDKKQIALISGKGGFGKSKLVYEFTQNKLNISDWNFYFLPWQVGFNSNSIGELPAQKCCVIIEDAHKQNALDAIVYALFNNFPYDIKIIITTRPSGLSSVKDTLRDYDLADSIELPRLSRDDSIELAKSILKGQKQKYAEPIYKYANGYALVIVMASELIQNDSLEGPLFTDGTFTDKVLDKLLIELERIDNRGTDLRKLLATISGLSPLNCDDGTFELLAQHFNITKDDLKRTLEDFETNGFVVKIGNRLRVVPDILADYILFNNSVIANQPTDFVNNLVIEFAGDYLSNILVNSAELEYHTGSINLTDNIWSAINEKVDKCTPEELIWVLDTIKPVSYLSPNNIYEIVSKVVDGGIYVKIKNEDKPDDYDLRRIVNSLISILSNLGKRPEFTRKACLYLWKLVTNSDYRSFLNNFSESPLSAFKKLTSLDNNNWFSIQKEAMDAIKEIFENNLYVGYERNLCEIVESALKPEIENNTYSKRTFTMGFYCTYDISNEDTLKKVILSRNYAFELYDLLICKGSDNALFPIANNLLNKLRMPYLRTHKVTDKAKIEFEREATRAAELLKKLVNKQISFLNNYIYEEVINKEERLLDSIKHDGIISKDMTSEYDIFYCIRHDWPEDYDDDYNTIEKRFSEKQERTARQLWKQCNNEVKRLVDFIRNYRLLLDQYGIPHGDSAFLRACAKVKPCLCSNTIKFIVSQNGSDYIARTIIVWLQYAPKKHQYELSKWILEKGNVCHKVSLAQNIGVLRKIKKIELVELIEDLSNESDNDVVDATIRGLGIVCYHASLKRGLPRVIDVICSYETHDDPVKLEILLANFNPHWLSPDNLSQDQISILLNKIKHVKKLERHHDTGVFLSYLTSKRPLDCVRLFLWRIKNITSEEAQPFPYNDGFYDKPENLISHQEYECCVLEILSAMEKYEWRTYFWCPTLVEWLDPDFSETTSRILSNNFQLHENALWAITEIFVGYKKDIFFGNIEFINQIVIESTNLADQKVADSIRGKLSFMPFSGTRCMSPIGEHDDLALKVIENCNNILEENPDYPECIKEFYSDLIKEAEYEDQRKLKRDRAELQEEEF